VHSFPPRSHGGIESYVLRLALAQTEDRVRVTILTGQDESSDDSLLHDDIVEGVRVLRLRPMRRDLENAIVNRDAAAVFARLAEEEIDLLHVHHWHNTSGDIITRAAALGIPSVVTMHDFFAVCPWFFRLRDDQICDPEVSREACAECSAIRAREDEDKIRGILRRRGDLYRSELAQARARFTLSENQTRYLRRVPALRGLVFEVAPLPQPDFTTIATTPAIDSDTLRVVSWGGLVRGKGMHILLEACETLSCQVEVHHFGRTLDEDYVDLLRRIARRTKFVSHGAFDTETMRRDFGQYDVAVFPSLFQETYGIVVDEAIRLGLPVVVSDRGAPKERIGRRGLTFPGGDANALASTLQHFLDEPSSLAVLRAASPPDALTMKEHWSHMRGTYERVIDQ
jgi:glycosyltransferase involved in cell wall biosynthesis